MRLKGAQNNELLVPIASFHDERSETREFITLKLFEGESNHLAMQSSTNGVLKTAEKTLQVGFENYPLPCYLKQPPSVSP